MVPPLSLSNILKKFITAENFLLIYGGIHKLRVVYLIALVDVYSFDQGIYFFIA